LPGPSCSLGGSWPPFASPGTQPASPPAIGTRGYDDMRRDRSGSDRRCATVVVTNRRLGPNANKSGLCGYRRHERRTYEGAGMGRGQRGRAGSSSDRYPKPKVLLPIPTRRVRQPVTQFDNVLFVRCHVINFPKRTRRASFQPISSMATDTRT
jgi:hypothetical protein